MNHLLCVGMGYCAEALARQLRPKGWRVLGTSRTEATLDRLGRAGISMFWFDGRQPRDIARTALQVVTHLLISTPPGADGDPFLACHGGDIAAAPHLRWIGYLSTLGVYGDHGGAWIDEETPPRPGHDRGRRRLEAEQQWLALGRATAKQVAVFRLAGIYGPGRSVIDDVRAGTARRVIKPGQVFNRIHVADIATVLRASMEGRGRHQIYNVTDAEPAPPQDVIAHGARLLGVEPPPEIDFETAELSEMAASFWQANRRASPRRVLDDLGVELAYPTYREGLAAILEAERPAR